MVALLPLALTRVVFSKAGSSVTSGRDVISFGPDVRSRWAIERPRSSVVDDEVTYQGELNRNEYEAANIFYKDVLGQGVEPFQMIDPDTSQIALFKFTGPPEYQFLGGEWRRVTWKLVRFGS